MKKSRTAKLITFLLLLTILNCLVLCGCNGCNYQLLDTTYKYDKAYVKIGEEWVDLEIRSWTDYEGEQLQIKLKDGSILLVSSYNCILYYGELPTSQGVLFLRPIGARAGPIFA